MNRPLRPYQQDALAYCKGRDRIALFMEMRLGKSKVIIEALRTVKGRVLLIAPLSTLRSWKQELRLEGEDSTVLLLGSRKQRQDKFYDTDCKWNLINYEGVRVLPEVLSRGWSAVVVDESAKLRNPKAQTAKLIVDSFRTIPVRAILSGQPAPESPLDYVQQYRFLQEEFMGFKNWWACRNVTHFPVDHKGWRWVPKPVFREKIQKYVKRTAFCLTRKQAGVQNERVHEKRYIPLDPKQKELMRKAEEEFVLASPQEKQTKWKVVVWGWLAQLAGGFVDGEFRFPGKLQELEDLLLGELREESVVVWFNFNKELENAEYHLERKGIKTARLTGDLSESDRWVQVQDFQKKKARVILCQSRVGLFGLNLSVASTNIYYSNNFSSEVREQTKQRIEHIGKKDTLLDIDLITEHSLDETIVRVLQNKRQKSLYYLQGQILEDMIRRTKHGSSLH